MLILDESKKIQKMNLERKQINKRFLQSPESKKCIKIYCYVRFCFRSQGHFSYADTKSIRRVATTAKNGKRNRARFQFSVGKCEGKNQEDQFKKGRLKVKVMLPSYHIFFPSNMDNQRTNDLLIQGNFNWHKKQLLFYDFNIYSKWIPLFLPKVNT